jgi:glutamate carboxypeptidase
MSTATNEAAVLAWLAEQHDAMLRLLQSLVNTDSNTYDKPGVDTVGGHLQQFFTACGIRHETLPHQKFGDAIRVSVGEGADPILLMGHRDTVFPTGEARRRPFRIENGRAYGPGVADMKSGLVMNAFVLAVLQEFGGGAPLVGLFTADEEIGSPSSRALIEDEARRARAVFNAEPARASGAVVSGRKGGVFMRFEVTGRAAHSGANFEHGISAIEEIARKTIALHALSDRVQGITLNVGVIAGGQTVNTVAPSARGEVDLRFITHEQRTATMTKIEDIIATSNVPGTSARLEITGEFLPLVETEAGRNLFRHYVGCARDVGFDPPAEFTGGCADSGFAASTGTPTLCGVGPVGGRAHSPDEYLEIKTLVPRAQALALAILRFNRMQ